MKSATLTREQTLAALLPLVETRAWATTYVDDAPVSAFSGELRGIHVRPAPYTRVEQARLDFRAFAGLVFLRRDEHLQTVQSGDDALRIEMIA